jgi:tetratricopeptide (TPR) repeat protein
MSKIILVLMIKNESKIIKRCIDNAINHVDAVSILDTGSTDSTVEIVREHLSKSGKPFKISIEPFKNFGYNRSISFTMAQELCRSLEWNPETSYALVLDADMNIVFSETFKDFELTQNGYSVMQLHGNLKYYNTRFMKLSFPWKCIGSTHECWSGDSTTKIPYELLHIDDISDGGCKGDKFERDIRLLIQDIKEDPKNARSYFYLANSLKDSNRFDEAIEIYKKHIDLNGWVEEVFYSHYNIGKCYDYLKKEYEMELWMNKAFDYRPTRAEPVYYLTKYFREHAQHYKAYHYYLKGRNIPFPKDDLLFIEHSVYDGLFDYENTIIGYYVNGKKVLGDIVSYINKRKHNLVNVWDNIVFYLEPLQGEYSKLLFKDHGNYKVSSCCIAPYSDRFLVNTRYVNYTINSNGNYHIRDADGIVRTKNGYVMLNSSYHPISDVTMMSEDYNKHPSNIEGLEDVRLYHHQNKLKFSASSKNATNDGRIVIVSGDYSIEQNKIENVEVLQGPTLQNCEKNWIYVDESYLENKNGKQNFIYRWHPLEIGSVEDNNILKIHTSFPTPFFFSNCRGSSPLVSYNNKLWAVVHFVRYSKPRIYYHAVLRFNRSMQPEAYSLPFCFCDTKIEYCLGFHIKDSVACFIFSRNDSDPSMILMELSKLKMIEI